jgi:hypothetical protein
MARSKRKRKDGSLRAGDKVRAVEDLPGVRPGTEGQIKMVTGLSWIRYRVRFDNGIELNLVDGHYLEPTRGKRAAPPAPV